MNAQEMTRRAKETLESAGPAIDRAKREILLDVADGRIPATKIKSFGDLHDYVDANGYGGAFEQDWSDTDQMCAFWNAVQGAVDEWIKAGGLKLVYGFDDKGGFYVIGHADRRAAYSYPTSPNAVRAKRNARKVAFQMAACDFYFGGRSVERIQAEKYLSVSKGV